MDSELGRQLDPHEEEALVRAVRQGDRSAFLTLARRYQPTAYRVVYAMIRDRDQARLLTIDTLLRAWRGIEYMPNKPSFRMWIVRLARNVALAHQRRLFQGQPRSVLPASDLDRCEMALAEIAPDHQQALVLRLAEGMSYTEIAETLGIPVSVAISRVAAAREALASRVGEPPMPTA